MRTTVLRLNEELCPCLSTELVFEGVTFFSGRGEEFGGDLLVRFRSFLPDQPLMRMTEVVFRVESRPQRMVGFGLGSESLEIRDTVRSSDGRYELTSFSADMHDSSLRLFTDSRPDPGVRLLPRPFLELIERSDNQVSRLWAWGAPIRTRGPGGRVPYEVQECPVLIAGRAGVLRVYATAIEQKDSDWPCYPDTEIAADCGSMPVEVLQRGAGGVCAIITGVTGRTLNLEGIHFPLGDGAYAHRHCLFVPPQTEPLPRFESVPAELLMGVVQVGSPRVDRLLAAGFEFGAVTGWFHRAKTLDPPEQGFVSLFVYLEALKHNWHLVRYGSNEGTFANRVSITFRDLLGRESPLDQRFVRYRNQLVHEGVMDFAGSGGAEESLRCYTELYALCAASYLALIGWTGPWNSFVSDALRPVGSYWTPNDLSALGQLTGNTP